ncbi:MAG: MarC family protein [Melioribacteraceae bacterium]|nr:MarC family protein [Melioribacteraceae bacterium]MCF8356232.1 MarC family protein [Melioribacteraceae bacterium]MCF8394997.1 MarC family protein [Melioribacteraceae bacterium]MCF8419717.1 MarC family protein [Melioribacteraceae bacterium]
MTNLFDFGLLAFTSLFTMLNPLGVIPVYTSLTKDLSSAEAKKVAVKATITALLILLIFAFTGKFIFDFFSISVNGLRIVGGVIFFMTGFDMLQARLTRTKHDDETTKDYASDIAITPLAIPMICGPGAITVSIVLFNDAVDWYSRFLLLGIIILMMIITLIFLLSARKIMRFLGDNGNKVMLRIMGLIVMVIAVEFFISGLKPILRDILIIK